MVQAKICGLSTAETVAAAVDGGAAFVGFAFFAKSPRAVTPDQAAALITDVPAAVTPVGLFVDADDAALAAGVAAGVKMLQLHGAESPERIAELKQRFGLPVMKVLAVATAVDLEAAKRYFGAADWLLFDAKPPPGSTRPGGNAVPFDWSILTGWRGPLPWMLAGGLNIDNVAAAVEQTGATCVDVSSGLEDAPGVKNPAKITAFLAHVATL